jgi:hypothetical protein
MLKMELWELDLIQLKGIKILISLMLESKPLPSYQEDPFFRHPNPLGLLEADILMLPCWERCKLVEGEILPIG